MAELLDFRVLAFQDFLHEIAYRNDTEQLVAINHLTDIQQEVVETCGNRGIQRCSNTRQQEPHLL